MNKISKLCVTGFSFAFVALVSLAYFYFYAFQYSSSTTILLVIGQVSMVLGFLCPVIGLVVSIVGVAQARKNKMKGLPFGIIGTVISAISTALLLLGGLWLLFWLSIISLFSGPSSSSTPRYEVPETESPWTTTETETEETWTDDDFEPQLLTYGSGPEKISLWSNSYNMPDIVEQYIRQNPEFGEQYTVECKIIDNDWKQDYEKALDEALVNGSDQAPDIYTAEASFVFKYSQGDMAEYASAYR